MFQWGWVKDVVGLEATIPIVSFLPMFMFAILFGLSMDYEVFILSRIREEYVHGDTPTGAVNAYVELHNAADANLGSDNDGGPDFDAMISRVSIFSSGSYYIKVGKEFSSPAGPYQLRVEVARGIQQESDANYSNDSIATANQGQYGEQHRRKAWEEASLLMRLRWGAAIPAVVGIRLQIVERFCAIAADLAGVTVAKLLTRFVVDVPIWRREREP